MSGLLEIVSAESLRYIDFAEYTQLNLYHDVVKSNGSGSEAHKYDCIELQQPARSRFPNINCPH